ncbi:hypothetical protein T4D_3416 [Trichinella pseudospiralis]|uniref:Uncharacterized protein n=1 Tax=Trichinella pseudospiralis TaxID=6337 RepID=A0A0V1G4V1_TRIPS|nr:hypothetical protein T4D_3416 [Trichinella pseudospiralis]
MKRKGEMHLIENQVNEASRKAIRYRWYKMFAYPWLSFYTCFSNVEYSIPPKSNVHFNYDIL